MRIALCFWGLCRSTQFTVKSIETQILSVFTSKGYTIHTYVHTYSLYRPYTNPRAGEYNLQLRNTNWKLLNPNSVQVDDQDDIDRQLKVSQYRSKGNPWASERTQDQLPWHTLDNHIRALWSLNQVTTLWERSNEEYDWILYLRPDVRFLTPFDIRWFERVGSAKLGCPDFQTISGCNDRFALCKPAVARIYGHRYHLALNYSRTKPLHAETFLSDTLQDAGCIPELLPIRFARIRADGQTCPADAELTSYT